MWLDRGPCTGDSASYCVLFKTGRNMKIDSTHGRLAVRWVKYVVLMFFFLINN